MGCGYSERGGRRVAVPVLVRDGKLQMSATVHHHAMCDAGYPQHYAYSPCATGLEQAQLPPEGAASYTNLQPPMVEQRPW